MVNPSVNSTSSGYFLVGSFFGLFLLLSLELFGIRFKPLSSGGLGSCVYTLCGAV